MDGDQFGDRGEVIVRYKTALNRRFGEAIYASWLADLKSERLTEDSVTLSTESQLKCDTINQRYTMMLKEVWCEEIGPVRKLSVITRKALQDGAARVNTLASAPTGAAASPASAKAFVKWGGQRQAEAKPQLERRAYAFGDLVSPLDERSTFDSFAVDDSNRVAFAAARQVFVKEAPADVVYIHGPSGVGKTHLLHAVGNAWKVANGEEGCAYLAYHNMTTGCSDAAKNGGLHSLHKDLLSNNVVLIDDIHLLGGAVRTQTEILNFVNAALASGRRLVVAGELPPAKLAEAGFNDRLTDRLSGGLSVAVAPGGDKLRADVLKKRLEAAPPACAITDEAVTFIATHFTQSMREAIGALNQLVLVYGGQNMTIGLEEATAALRDRLSDRRRTPTLEEAADETAKAFDITLGELKGRGQPQRLARARHAFVFIGREVLRESFPRISKALGRDHTTAMSGYHRAQALLERDKKFQSQITRIRSALGGPQI